MPRSDIASTLEPTQYDALAQQDLPAHHDAVPAVYRATARLRARWLTHYRLADPALAVVLLGLATAALIAAR